MRGHTGMSSFGRLRPITDNRTKEGLCRSRPGKDASHQRFLGECALCRSGTVLREEVQSFLLDRIQPDRGRRVHDAKLSEWDSAPGRTSRRRTLPGEPVPVREDSSTASPTGPGRSARTGDDYGGGGDRLGYGEQPHSLRGGFTVEQSGHALRERLHLPRWECVSGDVYL